MLRENCLAALSKVGPRFCASSCYHALVLVFLLYDIMVLGWEVDLETPQHNYFWAENAIALFSSEMYWGVSKSTSHPKIMTCLPRVNPSLNFHFISDSRAMDENTIILSISLAHSFLFVSTFHIRLSGRCGEWWLLLGVCTCVSTLFHKIRSPSAKISCIKLDNERTERLVAMHLFL